MCCWRCNLHIQGMLLLGCKVVKEMGQSWCGVKSGEEDEAVMVWDAWATALACTAEG